jgi:hypothetical protein
MSLSPLDSSHITGYGKLWESNARTLLKDHSMKVSFSSDSKKFTILGSSHLSKQDLQKIFDENIYICWKPHILDKTDSLGNYEVELKPDINPTILEQASLSLKSLQKKQDPYSSIGIVDLDENPKVEWGLFNPPPLWKIFL